MSILGTATRPTSGRAPIRMWLYGDPDAGKTHFAKQFPKPLLLSTDGNYIYETIPANSIDAWEVGALAKPEQKSKALVNIIQELKNTTEFDTIIVDLIDGTQRLVRAHFLKLLNIVHESDLNYGKAYQTVNENFIAQIEQLFKLPVNIIIISHQSKEVIKPKNGAEYTIFKPSLDDKYHHTIEGYCNLVSRVYMDVDDKGRPVRKLSLTIKDNEYGINRLGQVEDLILTHNGNNYADFMAIWQELYDKRGLGLLPQDENTVRKQLEAQKETDKKSELLDKAKRAEQEAAKQKAEALAKKEALLSRKNKPAEATTEPITEPVTEDVEPVVEKVEETKTETTKELKVDSVNPSVAEKVAKIKAAKETFKTDTKADATKVEDVKTSSVATADGIDDGEPAIVKTDAVQAKLDRVKMMRAKEQAALAAKNNK